MKLYVEREYASYGEKFVEASRDQIENNEIVQDLIIRGRYKEWCNQWYEYHSTRENPDPMSFEEWIT